MSGDIILVIVVFTALAFDLTNGFHDTANAMAASISTGALKPKVAVGLSAILNLVGAFLSVQVALTVTNAVINLQTKDGAPNPALLADGGEAVLLLHSLGTDLHVWDPQAAALARRGHRVLRMDLRGHGLTGSVGRGRGSGR